LGGRTGVGVDFYVIKLSVQKIIDIMPLTAEGAKSIFAGFNISVTADNVKKVVTLVNEYAEKPKKQKEEAEAPAE